MPLYAKEGDIISRVFPDGRVNVVGRLIQIYHTGPETANTALTCFVPSAGFNTAQVVVCPDGSELDMPDVVIYYRRPGEEKSRPITQRS